VVFWVFTCVVCWLRESLHPEEGTDVFSRNVGKKYTTAFIQAADHDIKRGSCPTSCSSKVKWRLSSRHLDLSARR
jgi:hypothetical protein